MTTRDKLAEAAFGCSNLLFLNDEETDAIDALEAIVQEARDEAIEECAKEVESAKNIGWFNPRNVQDALAMHLRALKKAKP